MELKKHLVNQKNIYPDNNKLERAKLYFEQLQPKVSVGLLVYNGEKYLSGALDSLLSQTYDNIEIIISDNASTDNTHLICQEYDRKSHRIKYIRQLENMGPISNFNFVLKQARGEFFMWASHDDYWAPSYILDCLNIFSDNPDCVTVFSHFDIIDLKSNERTQIISPTSCSSTSQFIRVFTRLFEMTPNMIYGLHKTEILRKVKIETFDWFDVFITIQLAYYGKILIIPKNLYSVGIDGLRKPYSLTGKYLSFKVFRQNMITFIKKRFPFRHRIPLLLQMFYVSFKAKKSLNKVIDNWHNP